jgi:hypothetical protein
MPQDAPVPRWRVKRRKQIERRHQSVNFLLSIYLHARMIDSNVDKLGRIAAMMARYRHNSVATLHTEHINQSFRRQLYATGV